MPKKVLQGEVVSVAADKTISVLVKRRIMDPLYKKAVNKSKKQLAHDENNSCNVGDIVRIVECKPLSKNKKFALLDLVKKVEV